MGEILIVKAIFGKIEYFQIILVIASKYTGEISSKNEHCLPNLVCIEVKGFTKEVILSSLCMQI